MRHIRTKGPTQRRRGQALVELALILPVILLLVIGMLEFARAWNLHQALTDATREGARRAVVQDPQWATQASAEDAIKRGIHAAGYDVNHVSVQFQGNWKATGETMTVDVSMPYRFWVLPFRSITMRSTFTMRNE